MMNPQISARMAIGWMVLAMLGAALVNGFGRQLRPDFHAMQMVFFYNIFGLLAYGALACVRHLLGRRSWPLRFSLGQQKRRFMVRSLLETIGFTLFFLVMAIVPLPMLAALAFVTPLMVSVLAIIRLGERPHWQNYVALLLGSIGVIVIAQPGSGQFGLGVMLMLGASFCFANCGILIRKMMQTEHPAQITFVMLWLTALATLPCALYFWQEVALAHLPFLLGLGAAVALQQYAVTKAFTGAAITTVLPFSFLNLLFTSLLAAMLFDEIIQFWTLVGGGMILGAALLSYMRDGRVQKKPVQK